MARSYASASSGTSPEQKTSVHSAPAERHEATHRALSRVGGGGPPLAPPGGSGARGAVSGRTSRACAPGSPPGRRIGGTVVGGRRRRRAAPYGRGACDAPACGRLWPATPGGWWPSRQGPGRGHRLWRGPRPEVCVLGASAHGLSAPAARPRRASASWGAVGRGGRHDRRQ